MKLLDNIQAFLDNLERKEFYRYSSIILGMIFVILSFFVYRFYSNIGEYQRKIRYTNDLREEVRELLEKAAAVKQQKEDVNTMLEADPNFKIAKFLKDTLVKLDLFEKQVSSTVRTQERGEQDYDESILSAKFSDMNMKDVSELLDALEQNKRIYTKELEIQKSRKGSRAIEVQLTIATLQPRTG